MIQIIHKTPFYRAALIMQAIHTAMVSSDITRAEAASMVPQYRSRGHGRGSWATSNPVRRHYSENKPNGARECARRVRQRART